MRTVVVLLAVAAAFFTAAPAAAEEPDGSFLGTIEVIGIPITDPAVAISTARETCQALDDGTEVLAAVDTVATDTGISPDDAAYFVGVSIGAYCPHHEGLLG
jgi:ABC-type proline/glycine betaine transport system substrate-binding protein